MKTWTLKMRSILFALVALSPLLPGGLSAGQTSLALDYACVFPLLGEQRLEVEVDGDMPRSVSVGEATGEFDIDAVATVSEATWNGIHFVGGRTMKGEALASVRIRGPDLDLSVEVPMSMPAQSIPDERGPFDVRARGVTPSLVFNEPGEVEVSVGDLVLELEPVDANGELTGLGPFEAECRVEPGQDQLLHCLAVGEAEACEAEEDDRAEDGRDGLFARIGALIIALLQALRG